MMNILATHINGLKDDHYIYDAFKQATKYNKIHIISDINIVTEGENISVYNVDSFKSNNYFIFDKNYIHLSTNHHSLEKEWFLRFFIIQEYMRQNLLEFVFYIDTDVLIYSDINILFEKHFKQYDAALVQKRCISNAFISKKFLDCFCDFLINTYVDVNSTAHCEINKLYKNMQDKGNKGGVGDMALLKMFTDKKEYYKGLKIVDICQVLDDTSMFDSFLKDGQDSYEMEMLPNGYNAKKIIFINNTPHVHDSIKKRLVKLHTIHCQGNSKEYIKRYVTIVK